MIDIQQVSFSIKKNVLVKEVSIRVLRGEFVVIMGANGAGKSTLLKMMAGSLHPSQGKILFKEKNISRYTVEELATQRAVLSQHYHLSFPMSAREIVMMGRYPYFSNQPHAADETMVDDAMQRMQVHTLSHRQYHSLSGGEAQKIQMCRVLAQMGHTSPVHQKLLLLDEPVSHLDIKYQHQLLNEAKNLCQKNVAVIAVLHDINLALKYADKIFFMKQGSVIYSLSKDEKITPGLLKDVFDVEANIFDIPDQGGQFVSY